MARVLRSSRAEQDLLEIVEYIAQDRISAAIRFAESVESAVEHLSAHPQAGRVYPIKLKQSIAIRVWVLSGFENYLLFYTPIVNGIHVLRIIDGRREIPNLLKLMI